MTTELDGIRFWDLTISKEILLKRWENEIWLFYKHIDGQYVSYRKASLEDLFSIINTYEMHRMNSLTNIIVTKMPLPQTA